MRLKRFNDFANEGEQQDKFNLGDLYDIADEIDREGLLPGYTDKEAEGENTLRLDFRRGKSLWLHASGSVDFGGSVGPQCKKFLKDKGFVFESRSVVESTETENMTEAAALAKQAEDALRAIFPKSNLVCRVERGLMYSIVVSFTLGKGKNDYKNGIYNNDPAWLNIHAWLKNDGSVPDNIKVESKSAGRISVKATDTRYAYEAVKTGWRDFTCPKDKLVAKLTSFFNKLKKTIVDNVDRMDAFDAEVARRVLDL